MFLSLLDLLGRQQQLGAVSAPAVDVTDDGSHLFVRASLAGVDPKSVQVHAGETHLALGGYRTMEQKLEGAGFYQHQSGVSAFYRTVPLPARVNPHGATTRWEPDDVLLVTLPKQ